MLSHFRLHQTLRHIQRGGLIAYPTESVYGLGCDPDNETAVFELLALKQRPIDKGLILIAADFSQLLPFLNVTPQILQRVLPTWPGAVTWLIPAQTWVPRCLTGDHSSLAVRVTAHPLVRQLCAAFNAPLVSTSANLTHKPPAISALQVQKYFSTARQLQIVKGANVGGLQPTAIYDALTNQRLR